MTYTYKIAKRLAMAHLPGMLAAFLLAACSAGSSPLTGPEAAAMNTSSKLHHSPTLQSISLSPTSATLAPGSTQQFSISSHSTGGSVGTVTVTYSATGGTITSSGAYTAGSTAGTYRVIAALTDGSMADTATVAISAVGTSSSTSSGIAVSSLTCSSYAFTRLVSVSSASQLTGAVTNARPGDLIQLAAGTYTVGQQRLVTSGTATAPIMMCGPRSAVIQSGSVSSGGFELAIRADYWTLSGFTVASSQQGIAIEGGSYNVIDGVEVRNVGQEAVQIHGLSTHNVVRNSYLHDTGKYVAQYGEAVYIGAAPTQWCTWSSCGPDRSDNNQVIADSIGPNIGSDPIDIKAGTTGTVVQDNFFDGSGMGNLCSDHNWCGGLAIINGQNAVFRGNTGVNPPLHGFSVQSDGGAAAYPATGNVFESNNIDLGSATGYGFLIGTGATSMVYCSGNTSYGNSVVHGAGLTNITCTQ
jgi:hypothetical protein